MTTETTNEVEKKIPILENWHVGKYHWSAGESLVAFGTISNDDRFPDGTQIRTSRVAYIKGGFLRTQNTLYQLGEMAP